MPFVAGQDELVIGCRFGRSQKLYKMTVRKGKWLGNILNPVIRLSFIMTHAKHCLELVF